MKDNKKIAFTIIVIAIAYIIGNRFSYLYNNMAETDTLLKINSTLDIIFSDLAKNPLSISFKENDVKSGIIGSVLVFLIFIYNFCNRKNYMYGKEHGSAEWGQTSDISKFHETEFDKNIILSQTESISMNTRKTFKNNNVLIVGGSGSGKTRFYLKPNLMQMHSSFVVTDPKGSLVRECGHLLEENGFKIKVFDLINMKNSGRYNPFDYLRDEKDVLKLVNNIIKNTNSECGQSSKSDFWEKSEIALLTALFGLVFFCGTESEKNIDSVMNLLRMAEVREDDENFMSDLDKVFETLRKKEPNNFALKQYDIYKLGAGKTAKSILISVGVRLSPFNISDLSNILKNDNLKIDMIGEEKTAFFIILPDSDNTFNFVSAIMYQQMFDSLFYKADYLYNGRLPIHTRFLLDEFANIGLIPNFEIYIATMRSREISVNVILQNLAQLKNIYKDSWETITGNCDTIVFLGGREQSTLKYISEILGKATIDVKTTTENKGSNGGYSINNQILGRSLLTPDEVGLLKNDECLVLIRGIKPFLSKKFDITKHKNYSKISDFDQKYAYTYEPEKEIDLLLNASESEIFENKLNDAISEHLEIDIDEIAKDEVIDTLSEMLNDNLSEIEA